MSGPSSPAAFAATYHDGRTAVGRRVTARLDGDDLVIVDESGGMIDRWPIIEIRSVDRPHRDGLVRLRLGFDRDDRLTLDDPGDLARLGPRGRLISRTTPAWGARRLPIALWGVGAFASIAFLVLVAVPWLAREVAFAMPASFEATLGERVADQVVEMLAARDEIDPARIICSGAAGQQALDGLVQRLTRRQSDPPTPDVTVARAKAVNALALPGGKIVLLKGMIDFAQDGVELAGVLAHEIGHLVVRHASALAIERAGVALLVGILVGDAFGGTAVAGLGQVVAGAAYSRGAETDADAIGFRLLAEAEIDARPVGRLLERLRRDGELSGALAFLATHPPLASRAAQARSSGAPTRPALDLDAWRAVKTMCD